MWIQVSGTTICEYRERDRKRHSDRQTDKHTETKSHEDRKQTLRVQNENPQPVIKPKRPTLLGKKSLISVFKNTNFEIAEVNKKVISH